MATHNSSAPALSENIEMYLVRVAQLRQESQPVPLSQLAQELAITSVSAHEMCRKLTEKDLVAYEPYKGVTLTAAGERLAQRVLRSRHLWETFFVKTLGVAPAAADRIACRFEHVTPDDIAERLAAFLSNAAVAAPGPLAPTQQRLSNLSAGQRCRIVALSADHVTRGFLTQQGITVGAEVTVLSVATDGTLLLAVADLPLSLAQGVAQTVNVTLEQDQRSTEKER